MAGAAWPLPASSSMAAAAAENRNGISKAL